MTVDALKQTSGLQAYIASLSFDEFSRMWNTSMPKLMLSVLLFTTDGGYVHIGGKSRNPTFAGRLPFESLKSMSDIKPMTGCPCQTVEGAFQHNVFSGKLSQFSQKILHLGR